MRVAILQRRLTHYRVPLFEYLRDELQSRQIELMLFYGQSTSQEKEKDDSAFLEWGTPIKNSYLKIGQRYFCWQHIPQEVLSSELIITTQENSILSNHFLLARRKLYGACVAFWGHGANLQSDNPNGVSERFKRWTTTQVDWWFAYTQVSVNLVAAAGFPSEKTTLLNNAADTKKLRQMRESISTSKITALKDSLGISSGAVGVFIGSLTSYKRLDFLFAAAELIHQKIPSFHLLIIGDGEERDRVRAWCDLHCWARYLGVRFGLEKIEYLSIAQIMLHPGAIGLGILDSFASGLPLVTTDCRNHGPEIAYLNNGKNGVITSNELEVYVDACVRILSDSETLSSLRCGCYLDANNYTIENMVHRFSDGIEGALTQRKVN